MKNLMPNKAYGAVVVGIVFAVAVIVYSGPRFVNQVSASTSTSTTQTINLTVNEVITLSLGAPTLSLPALTPGAAVTATSSATVTTNSMSGWNLQVNRTSPTSTIASGTITFPDATAWNGSNNATTSANIGADLSFRVQSASTTTGVYNTAWWGTDDTAPNALYAGFPTGATTVAATSSYNATSSIVIMAVRANAPATQTATTYSGTITVTAIALP